MKKVTKEYIEWHSPNNKYPTTATKVLLQTNDGLFFGCWDKQKQKWYALDDGSAWGRSLNLDTHVYYWSFPPKGIHDIYYSL